MGKSSLISISTPILTYSVLVRALLEYMYIEINRGSSSFCCSNAASLQKQWPSSQSRSYYVHVSAQYLQTNEMFAAIAWLFALTRKDVGTTSSFTILFLSFSNKHQSSVSHIPLVLKRSIRTLSPRSRQDEKTSFLILDRAQNLPSLLFCQKHYAVDIADPRSMQDACH